MRRLHRSLKAPFFESRRARLDVPEESPMPGRAERSGLIDDSAHGHPDEMSLRTIALAGRASADLAGLPTLARSRQGRVSPCRHGLLGLPPGATRCTGGAFPWRRR